MPEQKKTSCSTAHAHDDHACGCGQSHAHHEHEHADHAACACGKSHDHHEHAEGHEHAHDGCSCGAGHSHDDGCDCGHSHGGEHAANEWWLIAGGVALLVVSLLPVGAPGSLISTIWQPLFSLFAVLLPGLELFQKGLKAALKFRLDELFLLTVAVVAAMVLGEYSEAALVTILFRMGELFEDRAIAKSKRQIAALTEIRPDRVNLIDEGARIAVVDAQSVAVGSLIQIKPGERVPLDCVVQTGNSTADCASVTGESVPIEVHEGITLPASAINGGGLLVCRTTSGFSDSAASRIIALVEESAAKKGDTEAFITRFARIYTPIVLVLAILLAVAPPLLGMGAFSVWISRALVFLVASCPCALVISVPLAFFAGIGAASKRGVIIKGSKFIERLTEISCAVFDKTGTLTSGRLSIGRVKVLGNWSEEELLHVASAAEQDSTHPIAQAIAAFHDTLPPHGAHVVGDFVETSGHGVSLVLDRRAIICGSKRFLTERGVDAVALDGCSVYVAVDGVLAGGIEINDRLREDAAQTLSELKSLGVQQTVMLTGDNEVSAARIAQLSGIDRYYAALLPQDKVEQLETCKRDFGRTMFTGDGINDAPVLAGADVGVAMGLGTDAAIEAADVVLLSDRLSSLVDAVQISRRTMSIARFNIAFALIVKVVVLVLGATGHAQMWMAVFADVGVSILAVLNSMRILANPRKSS